MFTVHHLNNSRSQRVLWALEELGLDYTIKPYERDPQTMLAPAALRDVHPLGLSPVVEHVPEGGASIRIAESGAILEYLADTTGKLRPSDPALRRDCTYWLHYAEGTLMPVLLLKLIMNRISGPKVPFIIRPITKGVAAKVNGIFVDPRITRGLDFINDHLGQSPWFAGDELSIADLQMSFPLMAARHRAGLGTRTHIADWLQRVESRPAFLKAIERGGPIDF